MRILIVEDEEALANGLRFNFEREGYDAVVAGDGATALRLFNESGTPFDLVILDLMLPGMSGYEICRAIREKDRHVPVLVLSARTLSEDRTLAFDAGTDQYLTKPFALPELLSRVRNLLNRRRMHLSVPNGPGDPAEGPDEYTFSNVVVNFRRFTLTVNDRVHNLTTMEMQLLRYFISHEGTVLSRSQILEDVWGETADITTRSIDNFVLRLRKLVESNSSQPRHIVSVRGTGYRFLANPDDTITEAEVV